MRTQPQVRHLPMWPMWSLAWLLPLCLLLGGRDFAWMIAAVPMTAHLVASRPIRTPPGFALWLLFVVWMSASVIQIDTAGRLLGFCFRALLYLSATVILLYAYNLALRGLSWHRVAGALTALWVVVVVGGYLGVLLPDVVLTTPVAQVVPPGLASNEVIAEMITPAFAQQGGEDLGVPSRPSAPFAYTNNWGVAYSLLLPFVFVFFSGLPRGSWRRLLVTLAVAASLVPALLTLNRGMFLALGVGLGYVGIRLALRGSGAGIAALGVLVAVGLFAVTATPVGDLLQQRLDSSSTNETRLSVYEQAVEGTVASPLFGQGAPRPAISPGEPAVGTQGQFWMVLFSHGFPGAAFFVVWLLVGCLLSARPPTTSGLWLHAVLVMALIEVFYYGFLGAGLTVVMIAAGLSACAAHVHQRSTKAPAINGIVDGVPA